MTRGMANFIDFYISLWIIEVAQYRDCERGRKREREIGWEMRRKRILDGEMITWEEDKVSSSCCTLNKEYIFFVNNWRFKSPWEGREHRTVSPVWTSCPRPACTGRPDMTVKVFIASSQTLIWNTGGGAWRHHTSLLGPLQQIFKNIRHPTFYVVVFLCSPLNVDGDSACWVIQYLIQTMSHNRLGQMMLVIPTQSLSEWLFFSVQPSIVPSDSDAEATLD